MSAKSSPSETPTRGLSPKNRDDTEGDMVVHVTEALDLTDADIDLTVIELRERGQSDMADWLLSSL